MVVQGQPCGQGLGAECTFYPGSGKATLLWGQLKLCTGILFMAYLVPRLSHFCALCVCDFAV